VGIVLGYVALRGFELLVPPFSFPREARIAMDARGLLFAVVISIATGLLFGIVPAVHATAPELTGVMKDGGRGSTDRAARKHLRDALIVTEIALAFVLLVGSGLVMRSFLRLLTVDPGIDTSNVLTLSVPVTIERFPDAARLNVYLRDIRASVDAVPGVLATAWSCAPPMQGACYGMPLQVASRPMIDRANRPGGFFKVVSPSYFSARKLHMVRGRELSDQDVTNTPPALVINERLA